MTTTLSPLVPSSLSPHAKLYDLVSRTSTPPSFHECTEVLALLTQLHHHEPQLVVKYGSAAIKHHKAKLGDRVWDMYERVFIAALSAADETTANWCIDRLVAKFGSTGLRMNRLIALRHEYYSRWEDAIDLYEGILGVDATHIQAYKRLIAIAKARHKTDEYIARLTKYTRTFASDESAWIELYSAYQQQQQYELAGFCIEELLLLAPEHYLYHTLYAQVLYAEGRYELARQYFSQSVELKPHNNLRALYGIIQCIIVRNKTTSSSSNSSSSSSSGSTGGTAHLASLYSWAVEKVLNHYTQYAPAMLNIVKQSLSLQSNRATLTDTTSAAVPSISTSARPNSEEQEKETETEAESASPAGIASETGLRERRPASTTAESPTAE